MKMMLLKACPFCKKKAGYMTGEHQDELSVGCNNVECSVKPITDIFDTPKKAAEAWNTRPSIDLGDVEQRIIKARIEELHDFKAHLQHEDYWWLFNKAEERIANLKKGLK